MSMKLKIGGTLIALILLGIAAASVFTYNENNPQLPKFSLDSEKAKGWWTSSNVNIQEMARASKDYQGIEPIDKLPISDLTVHHGSKGKPSEDGCFISFSYYDYKEDLDQKYKEYVDRKSEGEVKTLEPVKKSLKTFEGDKEVTLQRYDYTIEGQDVLAGYQIGYIALSSGHIRTETVCETPDDLDKSISIIDAVQLSEF